MTSPSRHHAFPGARVPFRVARRSLGVLFAGLLLVAAAGASGGTVPGPPLAGAEPDAICLSRSDAGGLGLAGFAGAVAAIAFVARRRRDPA